MGPKELVDGLDDVGYVASVSPAHHTDLVGTPIGSYEEFPEDNSLAGIPHLRCTKKIWGVERTVVLFFSQQLHDGQVRGLQQHLEKRLMQLREWKETLAKPRTGPRSDAAGQKQVAKFTLGQYMKQILQVEYHHDRKGADRLEFWVDEEARTELDERDHDN